MGDPKSTGWKDVSGWHLLKQQQQTEEQRKQQLQQDRAVRRKRGAGFERLELDCRNRAKYPQRWT